MLPRCIKDWTTGDTERTKEVVEISRLFSTSNAAHDKVGMEEGIIDVLSPPTQIHFGGSCW